jgi:hypothetical protein
MELEKFKLCLWSLKGKAVSRIVLGFNSLEAQKIGNLLQTAYELGIKEGLSRK